MFKEKVLSFADWLNTVLFAFIKKVNNSIYWRWGFIGILIVFLFNAYLANNEQADLITCLNDYNKDYQENPSGIFKGLACKKGQTACQEAAIFIGDVNDSKSTEFSLFKTAHPDIKMMCFHSPGGSTRAAKALSGEMQKSSFNTCMAEEYYYYPPVLDYKRPLQVAGELTPVKFKTEAKCGSACPFLLASGDQRLAIGEEFSIGIHRVSSGSCETGYKGLPTLHFEHHIQEIVKNLDRDELNAMYHEAMAHPSKGKMREVSEEDFQRYNLFTKFE